VTRIAAFVPDLMDRSKVAAAAPGDVTFVRTAADLAGTGAEVVVVDLARPGVLDALPQLGAARTIGFASHVDRELAAAASGAGCREVMARSKFFASLPDLLA
jgi:hypothetical protein